jgi:hypothetical protein
MSGPVQSKHGEFKADVPGTVLIEFLEKPALTDAMGQHGDGEERQPVYACRLKSGRAVLAKWSGAGQVPVFNEEVVVRINAIGKAKVTGFFVQHGYLGVLCLPLNPPEWYVRQNGAGAISHVFGSELGAEE